MDALKVPSYREYFCAFDAYISPILINLHWLPVEFRIKFKILLLVFKALYSTAPIYIQELVQRYRPARKLRSSSQVLLSVKSYNLKSCGYRSSSVAAPILWNSLPATIRNTTDIDSFKSSLKTYFFKLAFNL